MPPFGSQGMYYAFRGTQPHIKVLIKNGYCIGDLPASEIIAVKLRYLICRESQALFLAPFNSGTVPTMLSGGSFCPE